MVEPRFRMASLMLESGPDGEPGLWQKIGAALLQYRFQPRRVLLARF
jgi:hypothetical protein